MKAKLIVFFMLISIHLQASFDHKIPYDDSPFWDAHYDIPLASFIALSGVALYEGTDSRLGKTSWKAIEAGILSQVITDGLKSATGRLRPSQSDSPDDWGEGGKSFPSGHVAGMTALVTPFVLEYQEDYPLIHLLWALPIHQMGGRLKAQAHWQSDVLAGFAVGALSGYLSHRNEQPLLLQLTSDGAMVGFKHRF